MTVDQIHLLDTGPFCDWCELQHVAGRGLPACHPSRNGVGPMSGLHECSTCHYRFEDDDALATHQQDGCTE